MTDEELFDATTRHVLDPLNPLKPVTGSRLFVVGGSSGIGLEVSSLARQLGAHVVIAGRRVDRLQEAGRLLDVAWHIVDANDADAMESALDALAPEHVVLSTGAPYVQAPHVDGGPVLAGRAAYTLADLDVQSALAWIGDRLAPTLIVARWVARGGPLHSLTVVNALVPKRPRAGNSLAGIHLPGMVGLVEALALDLAPTRVNIVGPSAVVDSPLVRRYLGDAAVDALSERLASGNPTRRTVGLADVARQVLLLVADPLTTGVMRPVDAGEGLVR